MQSWLYMGAGFGLLFLGGEWLVRGAARVALRLGLSPLLIGLTVVAFGTSSPELFVSLKAVLTGHGGIATGNVVGSNIANVGLILGVCAMVFPLRVALQVLRVDLPVLLVVSALFWLLLRDGVLDRAEAAALVLCLAAYLLVQVRLARRGVTPEITREFDQALPRPARHPAVDVALIAGGLASLVVGGRLLVTGAVDLARAAGVSESVIGLTMVAVGTSLPELAASLVAAWRREGDIAVGNIVGSNLFNLLAVAGTCGLVAPLDAQGVTAFDFGIMLALVIIVLPLMWSGFTLHRWEGAVLLLCYAGYIGYVVWRAGVPG